jgi:hypothetical protein
MRAGIEERKKLAKGKEEHDVVWLWHTSDSHKFKSSHLIPSHLISSHLDTANVE